MGRIDGGGGGRGKTGERDGTTVAHGGTAYCIPEVGGNGGYRFGEKEGRKVGGRVALDGRGGRARQSNSRAAACGAQANVRPSERVSGGAVAVRASSLLKRAIWNEAGGRTDGRAGSTLGEPKSGIENGGKTRSPSAGSMLHPAPLGIESDAGATALCSVWKRECDSRR